MLLKQLYLKCCCAYTKTSAHCGTDMFVNARMIGGWRESLIIHPISDLVTRCRWLWVVGDVVVVGAKDKTLVHIP